MNCPHCGRPMQKGHITGNHVLRILPESSEQRTLQRSGARFSAEEYRQANLPGYALDVPYAGLAPWVSAVYCLACKKVICQLDMIIPDEEVVR